MARMTGRANTSQEALNALLREILPRQGAWSDAGYLWLTDRSRRLSTAEHTRSLSAFI